MQVGQLCLGFLQNTISVGAVEDGMRYAICSSTGDTYKREITGERYMLTLMFTRSSHLADT
jgi:hypothetical protein